MKRLSFEQAMEANEVALRENPDRDLVDPTLLLYQWSAAHDLDRIKENFETGDQFAMMLALRKCANHDLPMPEWLSRAYIAAFDKVLNYHSGSWDEVFGKPLKKGQHLSTLRTKRTKTMPVYNRCVELVKNGHPKNRDLFRKVGEEFGVSRTIAENMYREVKKEQ